MERFSEGVGIKCTDENIHFPGKYHFFGSPKKKMKDPEKI